MNNSNLTIIALGDVVGKAGKALVRKALRSLRDELNPDFVVVNGENITGGLGIDRDCFKDLKSFGVDVITLGDHAYHKRGAFELLDTQRGDLVRPANFPLGAPGTGCTIIRQGNHPPIGVVNLLGRVFIEKSLDCPFQCMDLLLQNELRECKTILVDFHAEATSEKNAFARYFDGKVSVVWGTHTHVQTNDDRILPAGTGYITDLGMCGPMESVIGMDSERAIFRLRTGLPGQYMAAKGDGFVCGIVAKIDTNSGHCINIEKIRAEVRL